jgi:hypothetical protein
LALQDSSSNYAILSEGLRLGFRSTRRDLIARLSSVFPPGAIPTDFANLDFVYSLDGEPGRKSYSAYFKSRALIRHASLAAALDSIASDVQHTVATYSRENLFLHSGVIGWRDRAILFPGRTYSGKSTLVHTLLRAGAVYFSDEFARIDALGNVHPFARPLSLRSRKGRSTVRPEQEGLKVAAGPCRVGAIVTTQYKLSGAWRPSHLSPGQATLELLRNTVAVRSDPGRAIRYMGKLASTAIAIRSPRGDSEDTAPLLLETLDRFLN